MTKFVEFVAHKNRHEFHENSPVVARASRPWEAGLEFSLHVAQARGRLKPELQTGRPRRNEAFARRDVAWPGPRVDPPVPTGGTPVPRGLATFWRETKDPEGVQQDSPGRKPWVQGPNCGKP